ncbi:MAG TPA: VWA domain-containing protein, partial [Pyrinomonadaceae bacterium]|nr:VWA domain-containing protein [Pyrinomonadaceae bacterium]
MKRSSLALVLACSFIIPAAGQQATPPVNPQDEVVRITTNLVQVDAVVTDRAGHQITNLSPEDFEVYEDGRRQKITNFSYIALQSAADVAAPARKDKSAPPAPPVRLHPEQVRRSIALVVDDLGLSFESMHFVRNALRRFVDEQMQPNDLVAIIRTGAGVGALQQFTTDKQLLYAAIDRVKWNAYGRGGIRAFGAIGDDAYYTAPHSTNRG